MFRELGFGGLKDEGKPFAVVAVAVDGVGGVGLPGMIDGDAAKVCGDELV